MVLLQASGALTQWTLDKPYTVDLDESSLVSITPYIGQIAFNGNHYSDGGEIQFCEYTYIVRTSVMFNAWLVDASHICMLNNSLSSAGALSP